MGFTKEEAKKELRSLINNYLKNKDYFDKKNEDEIREKLIDPMFEILGWDLEGKSYIDEVQVEETFAGKESKNKRADYTFRLHGLTKLIAEAKSIKEDPQLSREDFMQQAVGYSFNRSCSWAVLTNFVNVKIFLADEDSRFPLRNLFLDDLNKFDKIFDDLWLISKESISTGYIDEVATREGRKKNRIKVDQQLFSDINHWRELISKDIKKRYGIKYSNDDVDEITQKIIDRLIFIRKIENLELSEEVLRQALRRNDKNIYDEIKGIFKKFNEDYNSKLFGESEKDEHEADKIELENGTIMTVISSMYKPIGRLVEYNFAQIDSDVLGNIYEQYLGYILNKRKFVESDAHKKEQGIYYTPTYIVDYIVRNTVGELLKDKNVNPEKIKILDPACGSGSFLIKSFDFLNQYWLDKEGKNKQMQLDENGAFNRQVKISKENIFGVDLDPKAVEISQLNLLLKMVQRKHRLPTLRNNIKVGNSLIEDNKISEKAFVWEEEFKDILREGGFDVIIGNPPYFKIFEKDPINQTTDYKEIKSGMMNVSAVFINKSLKLLKKGGYLGMIVPKMLAFTDSWGKIRNKILKNFKIVKVVDCGKAFKDVLLEQIIFILKKEPTVLDNNFIIVGELQNQVITETAKISQELCLEDNTIHLEPKQIAYEIKSSMEQSKIKLGKITEITLGLGIQGEDFFSEKPKDGYEKVLRGDDIQRFFIRGSKFYDPSDKNIIKLKTTIEKFKRPHIVAQRIVAHIKDHIKITSAIDEEGLFSFNTVTNIFVVDKKYSLEYIVALLNSNAVQYYTYKFIYSNAIRSMDFYKAYASRIPIPSDNKSEQEHIQKLIENIINLHKKLLDFGGKQTNETEKIKMEIEKMEKEVNYKIYSLYGLNKKEIELIESSLN